MAAETVLVFIQRLLIVILFFAIGLSWLVGKDFLPPLDEGSIWVQMQLPPGISQEKSKQMAADFRKVIKKFNEVSYVMTQVGRDDEGTDAFSLSHVECCIGLKPYNSWKRVRDYLDGTLELRPSCEVALKKIIEFAYCN